MEYHDFVGMPLEDARKILENDYPGILYRVIKYHSPKEQKGKDHLHWTERVVRQRVMADSELELIVSAFYDQI